MEHEWTGSLENIHNQNNSIKTLQTCGHILKVSSWIF